MSKNKYFDAFGQPFSAEDVSWRLQWVDKTKLEGIAVPYLDARAIADRLDNVVGQNRWKDSYTPWHDCMMNKRQKSSQLCTISIYDEELGEWIDKTDGAEDSDIEPVKGGLSDAFKRAAVKWNIGRYLYGFDSVWVKAQARGDSYIIPKSENEKLTKAYNDTVAKMFGANPGNAGGKTQNAGNQSNTGAAVSSPPKASQAAKPAPAENDGKADIYEVKNIRVEGEGDNTRSTMVLSRDGNNSTVFMNGSDPQLKTGTKIMNIKGRKMKNAYGTYSFLESYEIAA